MLVLIDRDETYRIIGLNRAKAEKLIAIIFGIGHTGRCSRLREQDKYGTYAKRWKTMHGAIPYSSHTLFWHIIVLANYPDAFIL